MSWKTIQLSLKKKLVFVQECDSLHMTMHAYIWGYAFLQFHWQAEEVKRVNDK